MIDKSVLTPSTLVGLGLPLIGMPLWSWIASLELLQAMDRNQRTFLGSLVTVGMALGVIAVVLWWEKKPLSALGIRRQTPRTIIFALSASIVISLVATLISLGLIRLLGAPMPTLTTERIKDFPLWLAVWIVVSSSVAEEVLYRGYVLERLGQLTGSIWWGGLITMVWFAALHLPLGLDYTLTIVLPGSIILTLLYIWRRDLITLIITHFIINSPILAAAILFALAK